MCIIGESIARYAVGTKNEVYTFCLSLCDDVESQVEFIVLANRIADLAALCLGESIGHTAAEDQVVHLVHQILDNTNFSRYFRATHNSGERVFDIVEDIVHSSHLFLHQIAEHLVVRIKIVSNDSGRSVFAVSGTKSVVHIAVSITCQRLSKLFLTGFHFFFSSLISRIFFINIYGFPLLFRVETEVLKHQHLARFKGIGLCFSLGTICCELHLNAQCL